MQPAGYNAYQRIQTQTSSPGQLVVMLYNALANDLQRAETALTGCDEEQTHGSLVRAQDIVMELMASLDKTQGEELATQLSDLYQYIYNRLVEANLKKDAAIVREVASLVAPLREAWIQVVSEHSAGGPLAQAAG
ncbi:MAG: flagellar export chaperone FliS [Dehalococcoidia bacterium]